MNKKIIFGIIIGLVLGSVSVYAGSSFYANGISVNAPTGSNLGSNATLQNALDDLYSIANNNDEVEKRLTALENAVSKSLSLDKLYPVGSIFLSTTNTNPSTFLGGTWVTYGASDTYLRLGGNGSGGANSVKLSANQIPTHTTGNQSANHTHSIPALSGNTSWSGGHAHNTYVNNGAGGSGYGLSGVYAGSGQVQTNSTGNTSWVNNHTHTITTNASTTGSNSTNHTHTYTNNNQQNVSINPKYVQVYAFKRTA